MSRKKLNQVRKSAYNKTPDHISQLVLQSCIETRGIESTPELAAKIANATGKSISTRNIRRLRRKFGYRYRKLRKAIL